MKLQLLSFLSVHLLLLLSVPASSSPCHFPAVFNLGDSNSDTGGLSATFGPLTYPYGESLFGKPAGRYSDGRLIIDFIAESLGLPYISAYLDSMGTNFSHGANFATALSTILPQNITLSQGGYSPFSLDVQLKQFLQFKSRSQMIYNEGGIYKDLIPKEEYFSRALYTFDIGQNDLTAFYFLNESTEEYIPNALKEFFRVVKSIYEEGGRSFWIHNTGPLGCLPYVLVQGHLAPSDLDSAGCAIRYNKLAQEFNRMLNDTVAQLRKDLPLAAFTLVDMYSIKYLLVSQATKQGFVLPFRACCGYGGGVYNYNSNFRCGDMAKVNGTMILLGKSCRNPRKRINWDGVHYTEAANRWVFNQISRGAFSDPAMPLSMACHRKTPTK
ncbi:GDSL esterase/lipase ACHE-like [Phoenix dactylifera]|uniref:GDSL esterase/lipase ACHE-like n=1 Tax=Phoenix dactylifera TaxID=42345 RepID=A0A8B8ZWA3_PHODC|nr:GDSL esterase/lipase ACHE-like [Phoenix dactylifera]